MSSATADSYPESIGSCRPPTPPTPSPLPPPPAPAATAPRSAPVRRQLDFSDAGAAAAAGAGGDLEDEDDFLSAVDVDDIVRGFTEAKRRAPPCVCGRGACAVRQDGQSGRWMYVCSSQPKCKHTALCEEVGHSPESPPAVWSHPKTTNPYVLDSAINHVTKPRTPITNVNLQVAGVTTPSRPQAAIPKTQLHSTFQGATPVHASPQGAGAAAKIKVSSLGTRSNNQSPICQCTAGKCKVLEGRNEDFYVCPIPKGYGACSYKVPVIDFVKQPPQTGDNNIMGGKHLKDSPVEKEVHANVQVGENNANGSANPVKADDEWPTPFDVVGNEIVLTAQATARAEACQGSLRMLRQPIATETPTKPSMTPYSTRSPMTPRPGDVCFGCGEKGHWVRYCSYPKPSPKNGCSHCGMPGHLRSNCPQL